MEKNMQKNTVENIGEKEVAEKIREVLREELVALTEQKGNVIELTLVGGRKYRLTVAEAM